jgi:DNA polymerase III psi subunit
MQVNQNSFFDLLYGNQLYLRPTVTKPLILTSEVIKASDVAESALLEKILISIGYSLAMVEVASDQTLEADTVKSQYPDRIFILLFSNNCDKVIQKDTIVVSPSLHQLLHDDENKRALWGAIKMFKCS